MNIYYFRLFMGNTFDEKTLITRLKNGDDHVIGEIFSLYFRQMCFYAEDLVGNRQTAEDLVVETFIKLQQKKN